MRLAAIFLPETTTLGSNQCINFGGKNFYQVTFNYLEITISKRINPSFIDNFYGENVTLISALVGRNGAGKTTLLKDILNSKNSFSIFEKDKEDGKTEIYLTSINTDFDLFKKFLKLDLQEDIPLSIDSRLLNEKDHSGFNILHNLQNIPISFFYSPLSDFNLNLHDIDSFVAKNDNIVDIYYERVRRHISLLSRTDIVSELKKSFNEFPSYSVVKLDTNELSDRVFFDIDIHLYQMYLQNESHNKKNVYSDTPVEVLEIDLIEKMKDEVYVGIFSILSANYDVKNQLSRITIQIYKRFLITLFLSIDFDNFQTISKELRKKITIEIFNDREGFINLLDETVSIGLSHTDIKLKKISKQNIENLKTLQAIISDFINDLPRELELKLNRIQIEVFERIIKHYNAIVQAFEPFKREFNFELESLFINFNPNYSLSQGEEYLLNLFSSIYSKNEIVKSSNIIIYLDEPDLGFHPMWKKKFVNSITKVLPVLILEMRKTLLENTKLIKEDQFIQIIFSTHDPLTLSDIAQNNVIYLDIVDGKRKILELTDINKPKYTFASNINDLIVHSFYINDGLMGDFAKSKIENIIKTFNILQLIGEFKQLTAQNKESKIILNQISILLGEPNTKVFETELIDLKKYFDNYKDDYFRTINMIGEPVIRYKLLEMYNTIYEDEDKLQIAKAQIQEIAKNAGLKINIE